MANFTPFTALRGNTRYYFHRDPFCCSTCSSIPFNDLTLFKSQFHAAIHTIILSTLPLESSFAKPTPTLKTSIPNYPGDAYHRITWLIQLHNIFKLFMEKLHQAVLYFTWHTKLSTGKPLHQFKSGQSTFTDTVLIRLLNVTKHSHFLGGRDLESPSKGFDENGLIEN